MNRTLKEIADDIKLAVEYVDRLKIKNNVIISKTQGAQKLEENKKMLNIIIKKTCKKYNLKEPNLRILAGYV
jgi:hypothetical protein